MSDTEHKKMPPVFFLKKRRGGITIAVHKEWIGESSDLDDRNNPESSDL